MSYRGGVYRRKSSNLLGGHAVKIVGWGKDTDGTEYWIVANSWNTTWGDKGYIRLAITGNDAGTCGVQSEPLFPTSNL
jgi:cathepsin B